MEKTLNQKIYEVPLDIKQAIYDRGYEAGRQSVAEEFFEELDQILMNTYSDTYGSWKGVDREIANLKKKYGVR